MSKTVLNSGKFEAGKSKLERAKELKAQSSKLEREGFKDIRDSKKTTDQIAAAKLAKDNKIYDVPFFQIGYLETLDIYLNVFDGNNVNDSLNKVGISHFNYDEGNKFAAAVGGNLPIHAEAALKAIEKTGNLAMLRLKRFGMYHRHAFTGDRSIREGLSSLAVTLGCAEVMTEQSSKILDLEERVANLEKAQQATTKLLDSSGLLTWQKTAIEMFNQGSSKAAIAKAVSKSRPKIISLIKEYEAGEL
jgi:hypothetical protein